MKRNKGVHFNNILNSVTMTHYTLPPPSILPAHTHTPPPPNTLAIALTHPNSHSHTRTYIQQHLIRNLWSSQHCRHTFTEFRWWIVEGMKPDWKCFILTRRTLNLHKSTCPLCGVEQIRCCERNVLEMSLHAFLTVLTEGLTFLTVLGLLIFHQLHRWPQNKLRISNSSTPIPISSKSWFIVLTTKSTSTYIKIYISHRQIFSDKFFTTYSVWNQNNGQTGCHGTHCLHNITY